MVGERSTSKKYVKEVYQQSYMLRYKVGDTCYIVVKNGKLGHITPMIMKKYIELTEDEALAIAKMVVVTGRFTTALSRTPELLLILQDKDELVIVRDLTQPKVMENVKTIVDKLRVAFPAKL